MELSPVDRMFRDLDQGIHLVIGFIKREQKRNAQYLREIAENNPKLGSLILPVLNSYPEFGGWEIELIPRGSKVETTFHSWEDPHARATRVYLSKKKVQNLIQLTAPIAILSTDGGNTPLYVRL